MPCLFASLSWTRVRDRGETLQQPVMGQLDGLIPRIPEEIRKKAGEEKEGNETHLLMQSEHPSIQHRQACRRRDRRRGSTAGGVHVATQIGRLALLWRERVRQG